ncbi:fluoride efflux transporter CrcB [Planctomicrobium sp. SH668]|uniref:fluoride efflux transporter CrcB n=1 Tax=Planctomicrobium sp. SH668 TaxID=3448126 RepID=UPI003F5BBFB2
MNWIAIAIGGALGAMARYSLSSLVLHRFPLGTFVANVAGCFIIGIVMAAVTKTGWPGPVGRSFLVTGFLGGLTTFSTYAYQSWELTHSGQFGWACLNVISNLAVGLLTVWLGVVVGEYFTTHSATH